MPLSEHEQRLLEQMERALYAEDPKLASTLRGSSLRPAERRRVILGILGVVVGLGLLLGGVMSGIWVLGVLGFVVMLAGAWYAIRRPASARASSAAAHPTARRAKQRRSSGGFMERLEQRWDRRREGH